MPERHRFGSIGWSDKDITTPKKDISYVQGGPNITGLVQPQDKVVARFALTTYPYSLGVRLLRFRFRMKFHA